MTAYYNENDPNAARWLRQLIAENLIAPGEVDDRSIKDVRPSDLRGFAQCHFFAGIGGWSYALRLAGWPDNRAVWTGSCPCQPFSSIGKKLGTSDPRHLWPQFRRLIRKCKPAVVFGEQVASPDGRLWLAGVLADLEALGNAAAAADLCAAGVSAPHVRQRLYWVAHPYRERLQNFERSARSAEQNGGTIAVASGVEDMGIATSQQMGQRGQPWELSEALECVDGWRRIEPGARPVADGIPSGVVQRRGYGNAIVPQVAAEFIQAYDEATT